MGGGEDKEEGEKEGMRQTETDKDSAGEKMRDRGATRARMTWIHRTGIDYLRMKNPRKKKPLCLETR